MSIVKNLWENSLGIVINVKNVTRYWVYETNQLVIIKILKVLLLALISFTSYMYITLMTISGMFPDIIIYNVYGLLLQSIIENEMGIIISPI